MAWLIRWLACKMALSTKQRVDLWTMISNLLESKLDLRRALSVCIDTAYAEKQSVRVWILRHWTSALATNELEDEIARWIPSTEAMIFSNLQTMNANKLFTAAAKVADLRARQSSILVRTLSLPMVLIIATAMLFWGAGAEFIPTMEVIKPRDEWTGASALVGTLSVWSYDNPLTLLLALPAAAAAAAVLVLNWTGRGRPLADRFPPFSLYRTIVGSAFLFTLVEMLRAGSNLNTQTLARFRLSASRYTASRIAAVQERIADGSSLGQALTTTGHGFPDPSLIHVVAALEGPPGWEETLATFLARWVERSEQTIRTRAMMLNYTIMFAVTALLALMVQGMFDIMGASAAL